MAKTITTKVFEESTMKFSEAEALYNAGGLENRDLETLVEMKGVYNKVKTGLGDKERELDKVLKKKALTAPEGVIKQLSFDSITMSTEVVEDVEYTLNTPKKFQSKAYALGELDKFTDTKLDSKKVFKHYKDKTLHEDLIDFVGAVTKKQFKIERVKTDAKS